MPTDANGIYTGPWGNQENENLMNFKQQALADPRYGGSSRAGTMSLQDMIRRGMGYGPLMGSGPTAPPPAGNVTPPPAGNVTPPPAGNVTTPPAGNVTTPPAGKTTPQEGYPGAPPPDVTPEEAKYADPTRPGQYTLPRGDSVAILNSWLASMGYPSYQEDRFTTMPNPYQWGGGWSNYIAPMQAPPNPAMWGTGFTNPYFSLSSAIQGTQRRTRFPNQNPWTGYGTNTQGNIAGRPFPLNNTWSGWLGSNLQTPNQPAPPSGGYPGLERFPEVVDGLARRNPWSEWFNNGSGGTARNYADPRLGGIADEIARFGPNYRGYELF